LLAGKLVDYGQLIEADGAHPSSTLICRSNSKAWKKPSRTPNLKERTNKRLLLKSLRHSRAA